MDTSSNMPAWRTFRHLGLMADYQINRAMREVGLTTTQYELLSIYATHPLITNVEAAKMACVTSQTASVVSEALGAKGYLRRQRILGEGNRSFSELTSTGWDKLMEADVAAAGVEGRMRELSSDHFRVEAREALEALHLGFTQK